MRPKTNYEILVPKMKSPASGRENKTCGADWNYSVEVRRPYKSVDKYVNALPPIFENYDAGAGDPDVSMPVLVSDDFIDALRDAIDGAKEILADYVDGGFMDSTNEKAIRTLINRADTYATDAVIYRNHWLGYRQNPDGFWYSGPPWTKGWGLDKFNAPYGCNRLVTPAKVKTFEMTNDGPAEVEYPCPSPVDRDQHDEDREKYQRLMQAALRNVRCAQEAAASVGTYLRNKAESDGAGAGGLGVSAAFKKKKPKLIATFHPSDEPPPGLGEGGWPSLGASPADTEPDPGDPPIIDPEIAEALEEKAEQEEAAKKAPKKKDNTLLIAGAAALGLLLLKK